MQEKICLIIPCYNEAARLEMAAFKACGAACSFLFVDDGSTDDTYAVVKAAAGERLSVLRLEANAGKAEAVRRGMMQALNEPSLKETGWIGYWDADLSTPLSEIDNFLKFAAFSGENAEAVFGSRLSRLGSSIRRRPARHLAGRLFATAAGLLLGIRTYDSQCGAKLFRKEAVEQAFSRPFVSKWLFDIEILMRLKDRRLVEYPLRAWADKPGSKIRLFRDIPRIVAELFRIRAEYGRIR